MLLNYATDQPINHLNQSHFIYVALFSYLKYSQSAAQKGQET